MSNVLKKTLNIAAGACLTVCAVTVAASVIVENKLGKVIIAGFKGAKEAIKEELKELCPSRETTEDNVEIITINPETKVCDDERTCFSVDFEKEEK